MAHDWGGALAWSVALIHVSDRTFRVFPGVSHWVQQEAPEAVNAMLEAWLSGAHMPEYEELKLDRVIG